MFKQNTLFVKKNLLTISHFLNISKKKTNDLRSVGRNVEKTPVITHILCTQHRIRMTQNAKKFVCTLYIVSVLHARTLRTITTRRRCIRIDSVRIFFFFFLAIIRVDSTYYEPLDVIAYCSFKTSSLYY